MVCDEKNDDNLFYTKTATVKKNFRRFAYGYLDSILFDNYRITLCGVVFCISAFSVEHFSCLYSQ